MSLGTREYLQHILAEAEYLIAASQDLTFEEYHADPTLRRAFTRSLEIMGEAAKHCRPRCAPSIPKWNGA
jgi:uncharacterized protein with HEPN domain